MQWYGLPTAWQHLFAAIISSAQDSALKVKATKMHWPGVCLDCLNHVVLLAEEEACEEAVCVNR
jgi:hypothetical protein